jgi:hypothetical protein
MERSDSHIFHISRFRPTTSDQRIVGGKFRDIALSTRPHVFPSLARRLEVDGLDLTLVKFFL